MGKFDLVHDDYPLAAQEDRCGARVLVAIPAGLRPSGQRAFQTMVRDLSVSGFSASSVSRMQPGTLCWLTLPGLAAMQAEVVWWESSMAGCAFAQLLSPLIHERLVQRWHCAAF